MPESDSAGFVVSGSFLPKLITTVTVCPFFRLVPDSGHWLITLPAGTLSLWSSVSWYPSPSPVISDCAYDCIRPITLGTLILASCVVVSVGFSVVVSALGFVPETVIVISDPLATLDPA